jgi:ribose 5-phosphate isomerase B
MSMSTLFFACDHAGYALKTHLIEWAKSAGHTVNDLGCHAEASCDYPMQAATLAQALKTAHDAKQDATGVLVCGSGVGVAIAANRFGWVRAAHCHDQHLAEMSRRHNDANVLCLGARYVAPTYAVDILSHWLETPFEGERHEHRVSQLSTIALEN